MEGIKEINDNHKVKSWLKKIGIIGFLFFLIKGLIWVAVFLGLGNLI